MIPYGRDYPDPVYPDEAGAAVVVDLNADMPNITRSAADSSRNGSRNPADQPVTASEPAEPGGDLLAGLRTGAWLDSQVFPPLRYAIPGIVPEGFTLLAGPPKVGKSWLLLAWALAASNGGRALSVLNVAARPVFYLALEDGDRRLQERCRVLDPDGPIPPRFQYMVTVQPGLCLPTMAQWLDEHGQAEPLVILDTLGKVMPSANQGEDRYQRDYRIGGAIKRLADQYPGSCIVVNHHTRKLASEDFVDTVSGTQGLAGAADTVVTLSRSRQDTTGLLRVTGRDVYEGEYSLTFTGGSWALDGNSLTEAASAAVERQVTGAVGDRMADVIAAVRSASCPVSPRDVGDKVGLTNKEAGVYLGRAADAGRLRKVGRGLYARVESVETPGQVAAPGFNTHDGTVEMPTAPSPALSTLSTLSTPTIAGPESHTA